MAEWLTPEESLPEDNIDVIVHYLSVNGSGDEDEFVTVGRRIGSWSVAEGDLDKSYWDIELIGIDNQILHWMPLPPIPTKD